MLEKGKLVRWIDDKGFGFINQNNGKEDIFIHISALRGMSRKPIVGDVIYYQTSFDNNGKIRAVNAKIEGVSQTLTLAPLERNHKKNLPTTNAGSYRNSSSRVNKYRKSHSLIPVLLVIGAVFIYDKLPKETSVSKPPVELISAKPTEQFQCQGKVWCSEMTSYEEALFYLKM